MFKIEKNKDLSRYNTLKIGATAQFFALIKSKNDLLSAISWAQDHGHVLSVLGGGSNLLMKGQVRGLLIKNELKGREVKISAKNEVLLTVKSGENWARLVDYSVRQGWYGLENLSLIYGTVGAAPIQNIGAYGVELKDVFHNLLAIDLKTGREKIFTGSDCRFGYRDSIFKGKLKGRYFIYSVTLRLKKQAALKLSYGAIAEVLASKGIKKPTLKDVATAVKSIRRSKLPDPDQLPNAGSFFKNIEISAQRFKKLQLLYPDLPAWPLPDGRVKIPSGWLIEKLGFKGRRIGAVGMHNRQALVMVNYGQAKPQEALALSRRIKAGVKKHFGLDLEEEINII